MHHRSIRCDRVNRSGVTNEDRGRQLSSGAAADGSSGGGAKNSLTKICATNEHKSEYDKVCRMHQKQSIATKLCYFGCQLVQAFVIPLGSRVVIACWTQAHYRALVQIAAATLSCRVLFTSIVPLFAKQRNW